MAPSSSSTTSTVMQGPVTLPLFKFSHCTSPNPQAKMIWTHLPQRSDMFVVFDVIRKGTATAFSETKVLKLVRGGELLEQVEIPTLQDQVRIDEERALSQPIPDNLLHVLVIVKRPLLALRYMLPDGQIRKTQMNFVPFSGCDVALEALRTAGLPIRDKDLPQVQSQRPQPSQSQPHSQERPVSLNADQAAPSQSSQGVFLGDSGPVSQGIALGRKSSYSSIPPHIQPTKTNSRPTSAPSGTKQDDFSRPVSASSRSTLNVLGSPTAVTSVTTVAKPRTPSGLLPSPVFNGTYEPFGCFQVRPMSAPEQTQTQQGYANTPPLSQMLPPERTLTFPEQKTYPFRADEAASQEEPAQEKPAVTKRTAKRQANPRAKATKPRKAKAKVEATTVSSDSLAPSSPSPASRVNTKAPAPSGPPSVALPGMQTSPPSSEPLAIPNTLSRKRSLNDQSVDQSNKRQAQTMADLVTEDMTESRTKPAVAEQPPQAQLSEATHPLVNITGNELLDSIDNLMRKYHDLPVPNPSPQTSKDLLAEYAAQSEDQRVKAVDDLICKCIQDENFVKLMEDVEGAWKRIGLGL